MRARVKRTEETAVLELLAFFEQNGRFSSSLLMRDNSGLERWIRVHHEGFGFLRKARYQSYTDRTKGNIVDS